MQFVEGEENELGESEYNENHRLNQIGKFVRMEKKCASEFEVDDIKFTTIARYREKLPQKSRTNNDSLIDSPKPHRVGMF